MCLLICNLFSIICLSKTSNYFIHIMLITQSSHIFYNVLGVNIYRTIISQIVNISPLLEYDNTNEILISIFHPEYIYESNIT